MENRRAAACPAPALAFWSVLSLATAGPAAQRGTPESMAGQAVRRRADRTAARLGSVEEDASDEKVRVLQSEPVAAAYGIRLGSRFGPSTVLKVLGEEEQSCRRDMSGHRVMPYPVEPPEPDSHFNASSVSTTGDGFTHAVSTGRGSSLGNG